MSRCRFRLAWAMPVLASLFVLAMQTLGHGDPPHPRMVSVPSRSTRLGEAPETPERQMGFLRSLWVRPDPPASVTDPNTGLLVPVQAQEEAPAPPTPPAPTALVPTPEELRALAAPPPAFPSLLPTAEELRALAPERQQAVSQGANYTSGGESTLLGSTDAGDLLGKSSSQSGLWTQKRAPAANEARVRGYNIGQVLTYADGAFWFPARQDLDTFLSKIDSGIIRDVVVIKGPYSVRYGPGFGFIDIATMPSPRSPCEALEFHGRTNFMYEFNGEQVYGRQTITGAAPEWGFRISYGHRTGNDYETGRNDLEIPASFNTRDVDFVIGAQVTPASSLEFGYIRLDQTGLEFPGQIFDTRFLVTDGYRLRYQVEHQPWFDLLVTDVYYNRTRLEGDAQRSGKRRQIPHLDQAGFTGFTDIDQLSTGFRTAATWGEPESPQLTVGVDFRLMDQQLNERDTLFGFPCDLNFPIPRSSHATVGAFFGEYNLPVSQVLTVRTGVRVDIVAADIEHDPDLCHDMGQDELAQILGTRDFSREFGLVLFYLTGEYKLDKNWTLLGGFGHAQRPPTLTELYAAQPFLAILQQGFTAIQGNPELDPERLWQIDLGLRAEYDDFRAGLSGFYAFIEDYITFEALGTSQGKVGINIPDALLVRFVNTKLATLSGGEAFAELDLTEWLTGFATLSYVEGRDHTRRRPAAVRLNGLTQVVPGADSPEEPLPMMPPLESRIGLRWHEAGKKPRYGIEAYARMVNAQDRFASSLLEQRTPGFTIFDIRGYWQATRGMTLVAGIENIFDRFYREHLDLRTGNGVFQPGRNVYMGIELTY